MDEFWNGPFKAVLGSGNFKYAGPLGYCHSLTPLHHAIGALSSNTAVLEEHL